MLLAPMFRELARANRTVLRRSATAAWTARTVAQPLSRAWRTSVAWNSGDASIATTRPVAPTSPAASTL